jgi:hypothetical protein
MAASIGARVSEIHTDHGPFHEQPERLAELLVSVVADRASDAQLMQLPGDAVGRPRPRRASARVASATRLMGGES